MAIKNKKVFIDKNDITFNFVFDDNETFTTKNPPHHYYKSKESQYIILYTKSGIQISGNLTKVSIK